jgi:cupin fold WbuC family metalloprotein
VAIFFQEQKKEAFLITAETLDGISLQARQAPRLRKNFNFHHRDDDICHRLLNAMEPASYIQPHRHLDLNKDETLIVIRGKMGLVLFGNDGTVEGKALLKPSDPVQLVNLPHGKYHTLVSFEEGSVFFEAKAGPFLPLLPEERALWAPAETEEASAHYLVFLKKLFTPEESGSALR